MATPEEIEREQAIGLILADKKYRRYETEANQQLVLRELGKIENPSPKQFIEVVDKLIAQGKLCLNLKWVEAFETFFGRHPELRCQANIEILNAALTARARHDRLEELLSYHHIYKQLTMTQEGARQVEAAGERLDLIDELVANLVPQVDGRTGRKVVYRGRNYGTPYAEEVQRIENLPLEELRAMNKSRLEKERIAGLSKEEIHAEVRRQYTRPLPPQFQPMPAIYIHADGRVEAFSKRMFAKLDLQSQKTIVRKYGADAVNLMIRETQETR
jgi:hypothetical protein